VNDSPFFLPTVKTLRSLVSKYSFVKSISPRKNRGNQMARLVGLRQAEGDYIITMDDDLQHPISEIRKLVEAIKKEEVCRCHICYT
jgi:glycosyltransferase involved in cell wall biosynthesis